MQIDRVMPYEAAMAKDNMWSQFYQVSALPTRDKARRVMCNLWSSCTLQVYRGVSHPAGFRGKAKCMLRSPLRSLCPARLIT